MGRRRRVGILLGAALGLGLIAVGAVVLVRDGGTDGGERPTSGALEGPGVRVSGRQLVDEHGRPVQLRGVNRPGTEYRCVADPPGFTSDTDGTTGQDPAYASTIATSLRRWDDREGRPAINTVRVPLNESCWLGINGVDPRFSGSAYRDFIAREVDGLTRAGMYTVLDLHWSAPGDLVADSQDVGPNADHSVAFWRSVADRFEDDQAVLFDLYNEPRMSCYTARCQQDYDQRVRKAWACYRDGCAYEYSAEDAMPNRPDGSVLRIVGTSELVRAIRGTGASNVIVVEGAAYGNDLWQWLDHRPVGADGEVDPNLVAEVHTYPSSGVSAYDTDRLDQMLDPIGAVHPVYVGEFGAPVCGESDGFVEVTMTWADSHGYGYSAWGWDAGEGTGCSTPGGPSLVTDDVTGAPTPYGSIVRRHLRARAR